MRSYIINKIRKDLNNFVGLIIITDSTFINNAIARLPKTHNWGKVRINNIFRNAECIVCGYSIGYDSNQWISIPSFEKSDLYQWNKNILYIPSCQEHLMNKALE